MDLDRIHIGAVKELTDVNVGLLSVTYVKTS